MRPFLRSLPPETETPRDTCAVCEQPLNCIGLCPACRRRADDAYSRELDDLCIQAVQIQRRWFADGKPDSNWRDWESDKRWLKGSGFLLTVLAIEERWEKDSKGGRRRAREADL